MKRVAELEKKAQPKDLKLQEKHIRKLISIKEEFERMDINNLINRFNNNLAMSLTEHEIITAVFKLCK
ncbi:hypothetical protein [Caloramator sp. Dgby_cultured_2]|uniref:hypothetical protein n=1 Tax=Caloramator sp. Dgby_cultured_2 TaxID=3029174 RepID=UPI00237E5866|nr:hypothetical protein [Caloramator sp. Dgby_cultured_2]WDU82307.1 hypothetical protein PWK10_11465 [Caloramator sp. Dgby_cultured_2]